MPFDEPMSRKHKPRKPQNGHDAVALKVQEELGRPLSWLEYCRVWNAVTEANGQDDFLTGEMDTT